jgi:insulysin
MLNEDETTFPLQQLMETAKLLNPKNCIIERCSEAAWKEIEQAEISQEPGLGKKKEPWYGVDYYTSRVDSDAVNSWEGSGPSLESSMSASEVSLPRPNRYIPRTLDIVCEESKLAGPRIEKPIDPPNLLVDDTHGRLFHRLDDRYALPQSSLNVLIRNAAIQNVKSGDEWEYDSKAALFSSILSGCFGEAMAQETYDADLAGSYWSLSLGPSGIRLSFFGFSDRLPDLALKIVGK